jgi:CrcB protein
VILLAVVLAGAVGAPLRAIVDGIVRQRVGEAFPWGTLVVNLVGSLILGFLAGMSLYHGIAAFPKALLETGFCGAFTTFSTFTYDTVQLAMRGEGMKAATNVIGSLSLGLAAAVAGIAIAAASF